MVEPQDPKPRHLNLEIPADLSAIYANFALITHTSWEVFVDFAQILPNIPKARVRARIVMTPTNAKLLLNALQDNIARYEAQYGEIALPARAQSLADRLFSHIGTDSDSGAPDDEEPDDER
jgi:hypothetical protein